ncbi:MAG: hypothetical protein LUH40_04665 [Clostridiales bacterium]|nr:hypothetical protein [Clostridiales bacterium]
MDENNLNNNSENGIPDKENANDGAFNLFNDPSQDESQKDYSGAFSFARNSSENEDNKQPQKDEPADNTSAEISSISADMSGGGKSGGKKPIIIAVCVVIAIALVVVIIIAAAGGFGGDSEESPTDASEVTTVASTLPDYFYEDITNEEGSVIDREEYAEIIQQQAAEATTVLSADVGTSSSNEIVEPSTSSAVSQGDTATNTDQIALAQDQIDAFISQTFYIEGAMYSGGEGDSLMMAFDGDDFEIRTNIDGTEVSICRLDGVLYLKRLATKQYVEIDDNLMTFFGITADDLSFSFGDTAPEVYASYDVTINGAEGVCQVYQSDVGYSKFYCVDGDLIEIDICDEDGSVVTQLTIDSLTSEIPADQLTIKGYEKSSISAIFADMM